MANRFVRRIRSGDIGSIEELKSEFRELAKLTHPDVRDDASGEFAAVRSEFEAAVRDFERHRYGAKGARDVSIPDNAWSCLSLLLNRGFPTTPRHEKQLLRYEYARWRLTTALGAERAELFARFESELLDLKAAGAAEPDAVVGLLRELIDYRDRGISSMRTHVLLSLGRLRSDPALRTDALGFVEVLARELGIGGELS